MNHMVIPLPSGVIKAPNIIIRIKAYLKFFIQNLLLIKPVSEITYIINGNWNDIPKAIKNCRIKLINSLIFKKERIPIDCPY